MTYIIGVDEAGYAPNLGPLAISATLWQIPSKFCKHDLYDVLHEVVTANLPTATAEQVVIADSKLVYSSARGLSDLEKNVLAILATIGKLPANWRQLFDLIVDASCERLHETPCHDSLDVDLPHISGLCDVKRLAQVFASGLESKGIILRDVRSLLVFPLRFNSLLEQYDNKGHVLSQLTLSLLKSMVAQLPLDEPLLIYCDKHGGRNRYGPFLQTIFPEYLVEVRRESAGESIYRWGPPAHRTEIRFSAKGERFLPSALASMTSKYLRELSMLVFNSFWRSHLPDVRPTAGYPLDAKRFKVDIANKQKQLGIGDGVLWRNR